MKQVLDALLRKLGEHSRLSRTERADVERLDVRTRLCGPGEDIVRQGERPRNSVIVARGMVGRYHTLASGKRQFLAFHIAGDMPDAQALYLHVMDHSVCAMDEALVGLVSHTQLNDLFQRRPQLGFVFWRETLIDAAIFRQTITNNSSRPAVPRTAHFFCEQFFRAKAARLAKDATCALPLSQAQLGDALGLSLISVSRALRSLRRDKLVAFESGVLTVRDWTRLANLAQFDPAYLHLSRSLEVDDGRS